MHLRPSFRVAAHASFANLHDKRAKIPQLYSVTVGHRRNDPIKYGIDGLLHVVVEEERILTAIRSTNSDLITTEYLWSRSAFYRRRLCGQLILKHL